MQQKTLACANTDETSNTLRTKTILDVLAPCCRASTISLCFIVGISRIKRESEVTAATGGLQD